MAAFCTFRANKGSNNRGNPGAKRVSRSWGFGSQERKPPCKLSYSVNVGSSMGLGRSHFHSRSQLVQQAIALEDGIGYSSFFALKA